VRENGSVELKLNRLGNAPALARARGRRWQVAHASKSPMPCAGPAARSLRGFGLLVIVHRARVARAVDAAWRLVLAPAAVGAFHTSAKLMLFASTLSCSCLRLGRGARSFVAVAPAREPTNNRRCLGHGVWVSVCAPQTSIFRARACGRARTVKRGAADVTNRGFEIVVAKRKGRGCVTQRQISVLTFAAAARLASCTCAKPAHRAEQSQVNG